MENKIVSVVIPTYNMEKYLGRCLDSVLHKDVLDDTEIIVVNDGSKDKSLEIAKSYQERYPNTVVIIDKPNGNYGSCINRALEIATGKYFRILDADDWFDTEGFVKYVKELHSYTVDMIVTHYTRVYGKGKTVFCHTKMNRLNEVISVENDDLSLVDVGSDFVMHKITYATALLREVGLRHQEGISYTDIEFVYYPLAKVRTIVFLDILLYNYFIGRAEQTMSFKSRITHQLDLEKVVRRILNSGKLIVSSSIYKIQKDYLSRMFAGYYHLLLIIQKITKENKERLSLLDSEILAFDENIYAELNTIKTWGIPFIGCWRRFHFQLIPPVLYKMMYRLYYTAF